VLAREDKPLLYMEDVGRHNAVDKIAGYMFLNGIAPEDKIFYTTGRLTSEMVIKTVKMRIPVLVSRSGLRRGVSSWQRRPGSRSSAAPAASASWRWRAGAHRLRRGPRPWTTRIGSMPARVATRRLD
jgi:hypothetical protein